MTVSIDQKISATLTGDLYKERSGRILVDLANRLDEIKENRARLMKNGTEVPPFPPSREYSDLRELVINFCKEMRSEVKNLDLTRKLATEIIDLHPRVLGDKELPTPRYFPGLAELLNQATDLATEVIKSSTPQSESRQNQEDSQKVDVSENWPRIEDEDVASSVPDEDKVFYKQYGTLALFSGFYSQALLKSTTPQDRMLDECVQISLAIAHDYLHDLDITPADVVECLHDIQGLIQKMQQSGCDVGAYPYRYTKDAADLTETVRQRTQNETHPSSTMKEDFAVKSPIPPKVNASKSSTVSGIKPINIPFMK